MKPEASSRTLLAITRSRAKMFEYSVPDTHHIRIPHDPARLFTLSIGILGDLAARSNAIGVEVAHLDELRDSLQFSARFFDAYMQARLNTDIDSYVMLFGAASFYLCDLPGSSVVLARRVGSKCPDLGGQGLEDLLRWMLQGDLSQPIDTPEGIFAGSIDRISRLLRQFFIDGTGFNELFEACDRLKQEAYSMGTPRQLLLSDILCSVVRKKHSNSSWHALPEYTGLASGRWLKALAKDSFIRELWPAQHLLGRSGVLQGKSAVVQMPTSAGKTKATELIIRSAFLSDRASLAVIVAPFRALCHEIKNSLVGAFRNEEVNVDELSDVPQSDFEIAELLGAKQVLVVTPEKLVYVLRHSPELAARIGVLIFDEGHQFDSGTRGVTYELLLTSLKSMLPHAVQKVLVSAVISNASVLGEWLNGPGAQVVSGTKLIPTFRTVAFTSWVDQLGRLEFVADNDPDKGEFFVPRVIEQFSLRSKPKERNRVFPEKSDGPSVALLLGLKLVKNGAVALFCGRKDSVAKLCEKAVDIFEREVPLDAPAVYANADETRKLHYLHTRNLGADAVATRSAQIGILCHHGNTPHGIRLAVEHAMRRGSARFVVCTSTLAQGVNLPIRYLVVTSLYQGRERIKVRDFHNLIGRAGRAGMHTEGSVLFADPAIYDKRKDPRDKWRWSDVKQLLEPANSEPCVSALLSFFDPLKSDDQKYPAKLDALEFVRTYVNRPATVTNLAEQVETAHADKGFTKGALASQISQKLDLISSIESFLMSHWDAGTTPLTAEDIAVLAKGTLAYFLAGDDDKERIIKLFAALADNVSQQVGEADRRRVYGKTLYGVTSSQEIEDWVRSHAAELLSRQTVTELLELLWPLLNTHVQNHTFRKCSDPAALQDMALAWIEGRPFNAILEGLQRQGVRLIWGKTFRELSIGQIVDMCEGGLAYDGALLVGAVIELVLYVAPDTTGDLTGKLQLLQKMLKYGLPSPSAIALYEAGFSDRALVAELGSSLGVFDEPRRDVIRRVRRENVKVKAVLQNYPSYFTHIMENVLR